MGGQDPGPQASARKLIGVRYRQALAELRMALSEGAGVVDNGTVFDFLNTRCLTIAGGTEQILLPWPVSGCWPAALGTSRSSPRRCVSQLNAACAQASGEVRFTPA